MNIPITRVAVVGATGPAGKHLIAAAGDRGIPVRAVSRSDKRLAIAFPQPDIEKFAADALDPEGLKRAIDGCDLVVDAIGLPADRMADHVAAAQNITDAVRGNSIRAMQISSFWSYLPVRGLPVDETHPREGGNAYIEARRAAEDVMMSGGAAVVQLPDFFGPEVHTGTLQQALAEAAAGKTVNWIGSADTEREYAFVPDAVQIALDLASHHAAYGQRWIIPGSGALTGRQMTDIASNHLGRAVKLRALGPAMLRMVSMFMRDVRPFLPMVPHYVEPIRYDATKLRSLLGAVAVTPIDAALRATMDWLRR